MIKKMKEKVKEQRLKEENGNPLLKSEEMILEDDDLFEFVLFNMKGNRKLKWAEKFLLNYFKKHGVDEYKRLVNFVELLGEGEEDGLITS